MSKTNAFEADTLALIFNATAIADIAENDTTDPAAQLYVALHTADPGEAATTQVTSEVAYTGYARATTTRDTNATTGWLVSGTAPTQATNKGAMNWGACSAIPSGAQEATHFSIGLAASGASKVLYSGALTANLIINIGITPTAAIGGIVVSED